MNTESFSIGPNITVKADWTVKKLWLDVNFVNWLMKLSIIEFQTTKSILDNMNALLAMRDI
jgi:hypothetical protein